MKKIRLIIWIIAGVLTLICPEVPKLNYFLVWFVLIMQYAFDLDKE